MDLSGLSEHLYGKLDDDQIRVGSVFYSMVYDTTPPKRKYYIVIGLTDDTVGLGAVYINSEINSNIFKTEKLRALHLQIKAADYPFLDYDSFIDCSRIIDKRTEDIQNLIATSKPSPYCADLSDADMRIVFDTLKAAGTIPMVVKTKYRLFLK